ncbi:MAG: DNA recombination protein RmuC [Sphingomonas sp.]|uniref:DNA recombination protein RmuC n=1 Tax=Sphingomonas sp. TaxID=28214 RepID=UPI001AD21970|nr:DNA recombination protein RmuC [Sphingomonas sp.]MBN8814823.1 DNA recombination protein RmuC [Sphingomonas sp.]
MTEIILAALGALVVGVALGWLLASRNGVAELAAAKVHADQHDLTRKLLAEVTEERDTAMRSLDSHRAATAEREKAFEARLAELVAAKDALASQFAEVGQKLLDEAQAKFLQRADERFREAETTSGQNLKALLQPVHERLERYEQGVAKVEAERRDAFGDLKGQIESMRAGSESVRAEASKLVNALRNAPKARGRWGEQQLRNVLESCGLSEHADFQAEVSVADGEGGRLRPDVIIRVPGGNALVIDAKVSLNDYQDAFGAIDDAERALGLQRHAQSMRSHVNSLGAKAYWSQFDDAPDYVIMFVPGEHFLSAALEQDPTLWDFAFDRRVLLATPTNLIAIARTVAAVWRQEKLAGEARQIAELGKELYARLAVMGGHVAKLGRNIGLANDAYNAFVGSLETQVLTQAKRFEEFNIDTAGRSIESPPIVEQTPRPLVKLASVSEIADRSAEA